MLPLDPGIYVWTVDLGVLSNPTELAVGGEPPTPLFDRLQTRLRPVEHTVSARLGSYHRTTLSVEPANLTQRTRQRVDHIEAADTDEWEWVLTCGMLFQRPLYVGKAVNLRRRVQAHLRGGSQLRGYLDNVGIDASDCTILLACLRRPDAPHGTGPASDAPAEGDDDDDDDEFQEDDESELLPEDAPERLLLIDALVSAAESLTIRLSHPLLNRKQD